MAEEQVQEENAPDTAKATINSLIDEVFDEATQVQDASTETADADTDADADAATEEEAIEAEAGKSTTDTAVVTDYAEAVRIVEGKLGKPIADLIRGRQADFSRAQNEAQRQIEETRAMQKDLQGVLAELQESLQEDEEAAPVEPDLPASVTPEHVELFRKLLHAEGPKWAKDNGWVKKDDVETIVDSKATASQEQAARITSHQTAARTAVTTYGEAFGTIGSDGKFVLNETSKARMEPVLARLGGREFKGTLKDVFEMTYSPEELLSFKTKAKPATTTTDNRTERVRRAASTDTRTVGTNGAPKIYRKGDKFDDVFTRAYDLSRKEVAARRR